MAFNNVTVGEKSSLYGDSNQRPQADWARAVTTELLRPDKLTTSHTPGIPMTLINNKISYHKKFVFLFTCTSSLTNYITELLPSRIIYNSVTMDLPEDQGGKYP